ncbi:hypothetical protein NA57DRAFT_75667 [Rhizodiscina lignyota]|uniref:Uncharacterized protein n=1 Tax=Rhizodiscina lignyota TaxID=1504668 RepID=A0A9P4IBA4_9PEZI|nr:hypothetical protein NA57DRAFT_75667 [Rhizodiscina lignyota]
MAATEIVFLTADPSLDIKTPGTKGADALKKVTEILKEQDGFESVAVGRQEPNKEVVQAMIEWADINDHINFATGPEFSVFRESLTAVFGEKGFFHTFFDRSLFGPGAPARSNVTEFCRLYFPASQVNPSFQAQVEQVWGSFEKVMKENAEGVRDCVKGWVLEETEHESVKKEKAKCFLACVGWDSLECHDRANQSEFFAKAAPPLLELVTAYDIWFVECGMAE